MRHKLYLVRFTIDGQKAYKVGITRHIDVAKRFKKILDEGAISSFKIMKSSYFKSKEEAYEAEQNLFKEIIHKFGGYKHKDGIIRFHNFYTKRKYNGITEIRTYNQNEVNYCWQYINNNGKKTYI
mgnify:CR=1 FL=1